MLNFLAIPMRRGTFPRLQRNTLKLFIDFNKLLSGKLFLQFQFNNGHWGHYVFDLVSEVLKQLVRKFNQCCQYSAKFKKKKKMCTYSHKFPFFKVLTCRLSSNQVFLPKNGSFPLEKVQHNATIISPGYLELFRK